MNKPVSVAEKELCQHLLSDIIERGSHCNPRDIAVRSSPRFPRPGHFDTRNPEGFRKHCGS